MQAARIIDLARPVLDSWWTMVTGVCFGLALGLVGSLAVPKEYRATATLAPGGEAASLEQLRALINRDAAIAEELEAAPIRVRVQRVPSSDNVELTVGAGDPEAAADLADRLAETVVLHGGGWFPAARASVPERPVDSGTAAVFVWGQIVGLSLFLGPLLVRSAVNPVLSRPREVHELTEVPLLAAIPRLDPVAAREESRRRQMANVLYSAFSLIALAVLALALRFI